VKFTQKQQRFIEQYILLRGNATEAALRAYDCKTYWSAAAIGKENLQKPQLAAEIAKRQAVLQVQLQETTVVTREWILGKLVENLTRALQATPVLDSHGKPTGVWRYDGAVANRALELLGKETGMFADILKLRQTYEGMSDTELHATAKSLLGGDSPTGEGEDNPASG